jgi:subtilase family serine protease
LKKLQITPNCLPIIKFILIPILASLLATSSRADNPRHTLNGHVPKIVSQLQPVGSLDGSRRLHLALGLASRDPQGLDAFIQQLYDPASPGYRHYLTPAQFTGKFGPSEKDYQAVIDYAKASGLNVTLQYSNRVVLDVEGAVTNIEKALQLTLRTYQHPTEARTFFAPDAEPWLPAGVPILHIAGLDNYKRPHPRHTHLTKSLTAKEGSAPYGQLWGKDFRNAYVPGTTLTGAGQNLGVLEFESYYPRDITDYENAIGMSATKRPQLVPVQIDGVSTQAEGGDNGEECSLDIEMAVSMAPGLSKIYVFEGGVNEEDNSYFDDIFESMVAHTDVLQFCCCWGGVAEPDPTAEVLFKEMATQGQSFFDASGDNGAFVGDIEFPSDSPSITQVGGTTLTDGAAPSYSWKSEVVWAYDSGPTVSERDAASSSGGISTYYPIPSWQTTISMAANKGSTSMRNTPDVAANAADCYAFTDDGQGSPGWGGTSCAAPLWAAFAALMNEQAAANNVAPVGFLNPALYALAAGGNYTSYFHDIISGNNTWKDSTDKFYAETGYDLCCGLGSMNGISLMVALVGAADLPPTGSLKVYIDPAAAITAGAKWQVDGGTFLRNGVTVTNLSVGNHTVTFSTINGWATPASQTVTIDTNSTTTANGTYIAIGSLKVTIVPALAISAGAQWQVDGGALQNSGTTLTGLAAGNHIVSYSAINGWTTPANQTVAIKGSTASRATGTYRFAVAGTYNGLFMQPEVTEQTAGMISGLVVTASGTYSGRLLISGSTNAFAGNFNVSNEASNYLAHTPKKVGPITLQMALDLSSSPTTIIGAVSGNNGAPWMANLTNELAIKGAGSAEYTALLSGGAPTGFGYLLITNHAGVVILRGALADGTPFSQSVPLCGFGDLPIYRSLYANTGLLLGWLGLESGAPSGTLAWIKQGSHSALYSGGFTNTVSVQGSAWTAPPAHTAVIDLPSGQLDVSGGNLQTNLPFIVAVSNNNAVVKLPDGPTNTLTGSINAKTGLLTITFGNGAGRATTTGFGAVLQNTKIAGGYFLGKTNAGSISLQP